MYRFLVGVLILTLCCGCIDRPNDALGRNATLGRLTTYAEAINLLAADCGRKRVLEEKEDVFNNLISGFAGDGGTNISGSNFNPAHKK